jgi:hypothetical protein
MLIGVISDTHDRLPLIEKGLAALERRRVEALIHPGDLIAPFAARIVAKFDRGPVHVTYGNNDGERAGLKAVLPRIVDGPLWVELGGRRILVHHFIDWCEPADIARADVVITGHTHEVENRRDGARLILNPGECCGWVNGRCTVAVLDTDSLSAEILEVTP